jgi:hypothetical protein
VYELCIDETGRLVPNYEQGVAKVEEEIIEGVYRIGTKNWFKDLVPGHHLQKATRLKRKKLRRRNNVKIRTK